MNEKLIKVIDFINRSSLENHQWGIENEDTAGNLYGDEIIGKKILLPRHLYIWTRLNISRKDFAFLLGTADEWFNFKNNEEVLFIYFI